MSLQHARLLVDGERRDAGAGGPGGHLSGLVHEPLERRSGRPIVFGRQDDAEMIGDPAQPPQIASNQLRGPVMMVEHRQDPVRDRVIPSS